MRHSLFVLPQVGEGVSTGLPIHMNAIQEILEQHGIESVEEMDVGENITVSVEGFMDLTVEKITEEKLSVAHYTKQNGDMMRDPEIVFDVSDGDWTPVTYRQDPLVYQHDDHRLSSVTGFVEKWGRRLRKQGFLEAE